MARPSSAQGDIAGNNYKRPRHGFGRLATLQTYMHGKRIWLRETSEGDAERGGNSISDNGY